MQLHADIGGAAIFDNQNRQAIFELGFHRLGKFHGENIPRHRRAVFALDFGSAASLRPLGRAPLPAPASSRSRGPIRCKKSGKNFAIDLLMLAVQPPLGAAAAFGRVVTTVRLESVKYFCATR